MNKNASFDSNSGQISSSVRLERRDDVALLIVENPPVNALSYHVRQGLIDGMAAAAQSDAAAIVLICDGRTFIAGADIREFSQPAREPGLVGAMEAMEFCDKPVVAAIHGTALGGGLETALCAHYRVAVSSARMGLPEVKLGLLPGGGGTQRLPRVVGPQRALEMMVSGDPITAAEALEAGLVDEIVEGESLVELEAGAVAFARRVAASGGPLARIRDRGDELLAGFGAEEFAAFRASIARRTRGFEAPEKIVQAVEAAVASAGPSGDFDAGLAVEQRLIDELMGSGQAKAQQYAFFAERAALKVPDVPADTPQVDVGRVGILGAGTMGGGIAMNFANIGIPVSIVERDAAALERGLGVVRRNYERTAARGGISSDDVAARMGLLAGSTDMGDLAECDLVIEAVFENMALKKDVFAQLDAICKPGAVLATNTSALDVNEIASVTARPEAVVGMHFFSPANVMRMLEVVRGDATSLTAVATAMSIGRRIGKTPVLCGVCHGFIGNRMLFMRGVEAEKMLLEGATPAQVDAVVYGFGFPMGPFAMSDLAGLDVGWNSAASSGSTVREVLCESGRRGQKNGRGYYVYDAETRAATPDVEVEQMIRDFAAARGAVLREVSDQEILERCLYPMVNEGAKILEEGIALRGSDVDVTWIYGYGWPIYTGGPMYWADEIGLGSVLERVRHYHATLGGDHWAPSGLLERLAAQGGSLAKFEN